MLEQTAEPLSISQLSLVIESILLTSSTPIVRDDLQTRLGVKAADIEQALEKLKQDLAGRCLYIVEVAGGIALRVKSEYVPWILQQRQEKPPRYSRAQLETLALIAYRQPITRAEIEAVRGVTVSASLLKLLEERGWIEVVGQREVPGRPALYATTSAFLDYFHLQSLQQLPALPEQSTAAENLELPLEVETA